MSCCPSLGNCSFPGFGLLPNKEAFMSAVNVNDNITLDVSIYIEVLFCFGLKSSVF